MMLLKGRKGFTLTETLLVVAITIVLSIFSITGIVQITRNMHIYEADRIAQEIFLSAQNHLTAN